MKNRALLAFAFFGLAGSAWTGSAWAGPAGDKAQAHFDAIAKADVAAITAGYGDKAVLRWVGGQLDGDYAGEAIKELWGKFTKAQGPLKVAVSNVQESANPKGATVTANVVFTGQNAIKVRYVLVYRDDKLTDEIWQVDPNLAN